MQYPTFAQIKTKIEMELDLETEDFIQPAQFQGFVNDAIEMAESEIHKLGMEDEYFLTKTMLNLTTGVSDLTLPDNIYDNRIKRLLYHVGTQIYEIRRLRSTARFEDRELINNYNTVTDYYRYFIRNDGPGSNAQKPVIELIPPSRETVSQALVLWYIRQANKWEDLTVDSVVCDLPATALQFVYSYVRYRCYDTELGHPNRDNSKADMLAAKQAMVETLTNMVPDEDSELDKDLSMYQDLS